MNQKQIDELEGAMYRYARDFDRRYDSGFESGFRSRGGLRSARRLPYDRSFFGGRGSSGYGRGGDYPREEAFEHRGGRAGWGRVRYGRDMGGRSGMRRYPESRDADTVRAAEIMTRNPDVVTPETPVAEVAARMRDLDVGVIPIVDGENSQHLAGIVTDRDIAVRAAAEGKDMKKTAVREIMSSAPQSVSENDHVRDVFAVMKRSRVRRVPVTTADGTLVGIISQADLAVNYAGLDLQRETEVEEVIERISEPASPRWGREGAPMEDRARMLRRFRPHIDVDIPERVRSGWRAVRREAGDLIGRGYDRGWR